MPLPNFIIAGTNKAGTSSIFQYLSEHSDVCASSVKETRFFVRHYAGVLEKDIVRYGAYFDRCKHSNAKIIMEASPGYLQNGAIVAKRIKTLVPHCKLLFVLRDPINRLYSFYNYRVSQHYSNPNKCITFEEYIDLCQSYESNSLNLENYSSEVFKKGHLKALAAGHYIHFLQEYIKIIDKENIKILFYEDFVNDNKSFMQSICLFLGIDATFFNHYKWIRRNPTYFSKNIYLHRLALYINDVLEGYLSRYPSLRQAITKGYQRINGTQKIRQPMTLKAREYLQEYYRESKKELQDLLGKQVEIPWKW